MNKLSKRIVQLHTLTLMKMSLFVLQASYLTAYERKILCDFFVGSCGIPEIKKKEEEECASYSYVYLNTLSLQSE